MHHNTILLHPAAQSYSPHTDQHMQPNVFLQQPMTAVYYTSGPLFCTPASQTHSHNQHSPATGTNVILYLSSEAYLGQYILAPNKKTAFLSTTQPNRQHQSGATSACLFQHGERRR